MGNACCGEDTSENGLPLLSGQVTHITDLPLNSRRKHIIKALYAVLVVGLDEMTSLFSSDGKSPSGALTGGSKTSETEETVLIDELIAALDRTLKNLDPELSRKQRLELVNRSTPLDQEGIRHRLLEWGTGQAGPPTDNNSPNGAKLPQSAQSLSRLRSQSTMGTNVSAHSRYHLPRILELWFQADKDCSGSLEPGEIKDLLHHINVDVPLARLSRMIKDADASQNGSLEFGEFVAFYNKLTTVDAIKLLSMRLGMSVPDAVPAGSSLRKPSGSVGVSTTTTTPKKSDMGGRKQRTSSASPNNATSKGHDSNGGGGETIIIPEDALQLFLMTEQKELHDDVKYIQLQVGKMRSYQCGASPSSSPTRGGRDEASALLQPSVFGVTARDFQLFLLDAACNSWIHPRESDVHMDMTQPYPHYFIDSSHNTYLAGHQLQGQSSCDMYKKALLNGCRCVEIDCWDGPNGDPAVTHGFTLTSRLRFYDVIATIKEYGFQTSRFPIMLSLELHTSLLQQKEMVRMMKDAFGDDLLNASDADASTLYGSSFSPEGLQYKILVKGKRSMSEVGVVVPTTSHTITTTTTTTTITSAAKGAILTKDEEDLLEEQEAAEKKEAAEAAAAATIATGKQPPQVAAVPPPAKGHHAVCHELNEVTYIAAMPFVSIEKQMTKPHFGVSSVDENKIERWVKEGPAPYIELAKQFLLRVYPKGLRTDSSNFNPQNSWNTGAQLVAMNIQTNDEGHRLNRYKFRVNGMCGMILKPLSMRKAGLQLADHAEPWTVTVRVLCGIQIPKPGRSQRGEVIDPYVELFISGYPGDDTSGSRKKTKVIDNNGFNPHWDEVFTFHVQHPELAMLCVQVHERDPMSSELIADNAVPLTALREGFRCVPLYIDGVQLQSPTCLLCHFSVSGRRTVGNAAAPAQPPPLPIAAQSATTSALELRAADIVLDAFTEANMDLL
jgi:hypothetical protein